MKKSTVNSAAKQQQHGARATAAATPTTNQQQSLFLSRELMTHFCTFVKICAIHHFKQCQWRKGPHGHKGYQEWEITVF